MTPWRFIPCAVALLGLAWGGQAAEDPSPADAVTIEALAPGEILYNYETGIGVVTNDFIVRYADGTLTAQKGQFNEKTGDLLVEGLVTLQRDNQVWRGDRLLYNLHTRTIQTSDFRTGWWPAFAAGQGLHLDLTNQLYSATNAFVTSDDVANPGVRIRARRLTIAPGRYFEARHAVLYVGQVPVFYFPYLRRPLTGAGNRINVLPGYRSTYGAFLLGRYDWYWTEQLNGAIRADYRTKRGFGGGLDVSYDGGRSGQTDASGYALHDLEADSTDGADGIPTSVDPNRYRVFLTHLSTPATNFTVRMSLQKQSDPYVRRDFFESEFHADQMPDSFLELDRHWSNLSLNLLVRPRFNDFFETVERLPDLALATPRAQLGPLPVFYEGESSVGYYRRLYSDENPLLPPDYSGVRADTFHQLLLPTTLMGWLNLTPRVGGRYTYYGATESNGPELDPESRWVFNTGAELSFKASQAWTHPTNRFFQIDGLRHIIQPSLNYSYVPDPSAPPTQQPFDQEWPSLALLPHWFPDYNSIDSIDSWNSMRLGLRNRLQTKRGGISDNLVDWNLYGDWRITHDATQDDFSDFFSDLDVKPWSWVTLSSQFRVDVEAPEIRIANHSITLEPNNVWSWQVGHRYLREGVFYSGPTGYVPTLTQGHDLITSSIYFRLNENYGFRFQHLYEINDRTMQQQYYTVYRDFRSWTGALTLRIEDEGRDELDFAVAFTLQLKAFPRYGAGKDRNRPSLLLGD